MGVIRRVWTFAAVAVSTVQVATAGHATASETAQPVRFEFTGQSFADTSARLTLRPATLGGEVTFVARDAGWAVKFPGPCAKQSETCPRAVLETDPADWLNPGAQPVKWGAAVLMTAEEVSEGSNVLQKGLSASGTQFKLQVDGHEGHPSCVVAGQVDGSQRIFMALGARNIADGQWHSLGCERQPTALRLVIDGQQAAETPVPAALSIVNQLPLRLGGKGPHPDNDQFHGAIDDAFVEIG